MQDSHAAAVRQAFEHLEQALELLRPLYDSLAVEWPLAVPRSHIVDEHDSVAVSLRARQILEALDERLTGKVLDFGCGDGSVTAEAARQPKVQRAVGYDIVAHDSWSDSGICAYTTDPERVLEYGPYDTIICYDVMDHLLGPQAAAVGFMAQALAAGGVLFIRFHPWTSRHGGHQYYHSNRAYEHLSVPPGEDAPSCRAPRPLAVYESLIKDSGLKVLNRTVLSREPEAFFDGEVLDRIIKHTWNGQVDRPTARKIMTTQYVDYLLTK